MDHDALLARILRAVDTTAYITPSASAPEDQREALDDVGQAIRAGVKDPEALRAALADLLAEGRIDRVRYLSALGVIAASPAVADYALALSLAGAQELAAYELDQQSPGGRLQTDLASVERHRGVAFFLAGQAEAALDHFTRALEYEATVENTGNVLAALLRLGELDEADRILHHVRRQQPSAFVRALEDAIDSDPDLSALRSPEVS